MRPLRRHQPQAPFDQVDQAVGIAAAQPHQRLAHAVFFLALVGFLRRHAGHAGIERGTQAVDIGPGAQVGMLAVQFGRGEAGGVHRLEARRFHGQRLPRGAEIQQDRRLVLAQVDVAGLDVQVQQLVDMHLAQAAHQVVEDLAHEMLAQHLGAALLPGRQHVLLQRLAQLVVHHHVDRGVLAEEIHHAHHAGMGNAGQRAALFKEILQAEPECRGVFLGHHGDQFARVAPRQRRRQVLLDRDRRAGFIGGQVDETEPPAGQLLYNTIVGQQRADGQRCTLRLCRALGLCHGNRGRICLRGFANGLSGLIGHL
ncbi:hypothetical protein D3C81_1047420 [compost metagenome]